MITQQQQEIEIRKTEKWSNIIIVVSAPEDTAHANDDELVDALQSKYDTLKEKLIYEALERKMGTEEWNKLSEEEKYEKMMEIQMKIKALQEQGMGLVAFSFISSIETLQYTTYYTTCQILCNTTNSIARGGICVSPWREKAYGRYL